jgi:hypothetical protein
VSAPEIHTGEWGYLDLERSGLREVGEVDFSDGCYQFDYTRVWLHVETSTFWMADDSGCSCPSPFESLSSEELTSIERLQVLIDHLDKRKADVSEWSASELPRITDDCTNLIAAYRRLRDEIKKES